MKVQSKGLRRLLLAKKIQSSIMTFGQKIKEASEEEVDLDDPNSAFIRCEKMKTKFTSLAYTCFEDKDVKANYAVYRKVTLPKDLLPYPSLVDAVEKFVNTSCIQYANRIIPSAKDILGVVQEWNVKRDGGLTVDGINQITKSILKAVIVDIRGKRRKDFKKSMKQYVSTYDQDNVDPAINDPILLEKLENNDAIGIEAMKKVQRLFSLGENSKGFNEF